MMYIAVVMLAPGQTGFYDDLSGIHLSLTNREAKITKGVNTAGLVNAVQAGKIITVSGSLGSETLLYKEAEMAIPTYYRLLKKKQKKMLKTQIVNPVEISEPIKKEEVAVEVVTEAVVETPIEAETVIEPIVEEEVIEIAPQKKKTSRKKKDSIEKED